jgi:D-alanyl-D-alanine carboxypeptidase (penicillin-binding protein 5/6)
MFLSANEQVSVENLLKGIVTLSGNDASVVLAECIAGTEQAFTEQMNALAKQIGVTNSHFCTANGWPDNGCTYVTARDLATIAKATIQRHPKLYKAFYSLPSFTWGKTMGSGQDITQANRDPILGRVPGADGLKTGHTDEAGYGFTGSAEQNGRRLIEVLAGMDSWNQRVQESTRLISWGFNAWNDKPLFKSGEKVGTAQVQMGSSGEVALTVPAALTLTNKPIAMKIRYQGPLLAPIAKGQEVAQLVITTGDTPPQIVPLVAGEDVGRAGFFGRIWLGLKQLVGFG